MARAGKTDASREGSKKNGKDAAQKKQDKAAAGPSMFDPNGLSEAAQRIVSKREIQKRAVEFLSSLEYTKSLYARLLMGQAPHMETLLHYYAYGKPPEKDRKSVV